MKKIIHKVLKSFVILLMVGLSYTAFAQGPPPPPQEGSTGGGQTEKLNGGSGPSGSGLLLLASLVVAYGVRKWYLNRTNSAEGEI